MTRNRDDFSFIQALRTAVLGVVAIVVLMTVLGAAISSHKEAAENRATSVAAAALQFQPVETRIADDATRSKV